MKLLPLVAVIGILWTSFACDSQAQPSGNNTAAASSGWQNIDVPTFKQMMKKPNTVVLDVRTTAETAQQKIEGAVELDFYSPDFAKKVAALDKTKTYLVYCRSGNRSGQACQIMQNQGFAKLYNMKGGMIAWNQQR